MLPEFQSIYDLKIKSLHRIYWEDINNLYDESLHGEFLNIKFFVPTSKIEGFIEVFLTEKIHFASLDEFMMVASLISNQDSLEVYRDTIEKYHKTSARPRDLIFRFKQYFKDYVATLQEELIDALSESGFFDISKFEKAILLIDKWNDHHYMIETTSHYISYQWMTSA